MKGEIILRMEWNIMLSIYITTYNHEKYIREALDSVLMQNTKYSYEVIVGDDASTDNTKEILKEYAAKYPSIIKLFLRDTNMGGKGSNNAYDLIKRCEGKYIMALEGDDFWVDDSKIETQITFLEKHVEYIGIAHNCIVVDSNSKPNGEEYPECKEEIYSLRHLGSNILPGQLTTVMYRNVYKNQKIDTSIIGEGLLPADRLIYFMLSSYGNIYCMQKKMSAYRHITTGGSSFSANYVWNYEEVKNWNTSLVNYSKRIQNNQAIKYSELMLMKIIIGSRKRYKKTWREISKELIQEHFSGVRYLEYFMQLVRRKVLKMKIWA